MDIKLTKTPSLTPQPVTNSSRNTLMEVGLLIVICALFFWFIIMPKNASIAAKKQTLSQVQSEENQINQSLTQLQSLVKTLQSNTTQVSELDQALPLSANSVELEILLNNLAQSVGVTVGNISASSATPNNPVSGDTALLANPYGATRTLQKLTASVNVTGTFPQLQAFLQKVETSGRLMDITELEIDSAPNNALSLRVGIDAYYLAP